jgi:hypothetical protein
MLTRCSGHTFNQCFDGSLRRYLDLNWTLVALGLTWGSPIPQEIKIPTKMAMAKAKANQAKGQWIARNA